MQAIRRKLYKLRSKKSAAKPAAKPVKEFKTQATADIEEKLRRSGVDEETIKRLRGK